MIGLSFIYKGLKNLHLNLGIRDAFLLSLLLGLIASILDKIFQKVLRRLFPENPYEDTERIFKVLQVFTAGYMAFAYGANDVANGIGPLAAIWDVWKHNMITSGKVIPMWILCLGGIGIIVGFAILGYRVIETIGKKITEITPSRGFSAEFGSATTVLICSKLGMPIPTTHTLVGAVIGIGMARGVSSLNLKLITNIITTWFITIPGTAILTMIFYCVLEFIF